MSSCQSGALIDTHSVRASCGDGPHVLRINTTSHFEAQHALVCVSDVAPWYFATVKFGGVAHIAGTPQLTLTSSLAHDAVTKQIRRHQ